MALRATNSALNAAANGIGPLANGGAVEFRTGARSGTAGASSGTLLVSVPLANPAFGSASGGVLTGQSMPRTATGAADGTIGHARIVDSGGNGIWDEDDIGTSPGNAITVNTMTVSSGVDFEITSYEFFVANPA